MKKLSCDTENCIPTPSSCVIWNGGSIDYLGICDGDSINTLLQEVISKLKEIAGEDLSAFDIDSLLDICNQKAPTEITIISILNLIKNNQVCLKDYIDTLSEQIASITNSSAVTVNLKCYQEFDNLGNSLSITRDTLDQLVIDNLCNHKLRIETLEGKVITLQSEIDNLEPPAPSEFTIATCINAGVLPVSTQIVNTSKVLCDLQDETGGPADITSALAQTPSYPTAVTTDPDYIVSPANWAENYNNLLIAFEKLQARVLTIETTCCALTCADVELGFSATYNEDSTGIILKFTAGAGTSIPAGFTDLGSLITITDIDGNVESYTTADPNLIANNAEIEIPITSLNLTGELIVNVDSNISNGSLTCSKCLSKTVKKATCNFCEVCATGTTGASIVIVYETETSTSATVFEATTSTTTTSTTTTTTAAP